MVNELDNVFMSKKELKSEYSLESPETTQGYVVGSYANKSVCMKYNPGNIAVFTPSDADCSDIFAISQIIQCSKRSECLIVNDPDGRLYEATSKYLKYCGYEVSYEGYMQSYPDTLNRIFPIKSKKAFFTPKINMPHDAIEQDRWSELIRASLNESNQLPITYIFAHFADIKRIPDFERFIAVGHMYKVWFILLLNSIKELQQTYGIKSGSETILSNCSVQIFTGGSLDENNCKYMSKMIPPMASTVSTFEPYSITVIVSAQMSAYSVSANNEVIFTANKKLLICSIPLVPEQFLNSNERYKQLCDNGDNIIKESCEQLRKQLKRKRV